MVGLITAGKKKTEFKKSGLFFFKQGMLYVTLSIKCYRRIDWSCDVGDLFPLYSKH